MVSLCTKIVEYCELYGPTASTCTRAVPLPGALGLRLYDLAFLGVPSPVLVRTTVDPYLTRTTYRKAYFTPGYARGRAYAGPRGPVGVGNGILRLD